MTKKIVHVIIFLIVAGILLATFMNTDSEDNTSAVSQLPALMLAGAYLGVMFVIYILPAITDKATSAVLDSGEKVERDPLSDGRAAYARGDYEEAMTIYRNIASENLGNRLPWMEIAKIQQEHLEDLDASLATLREALESHEWPVDDAAYFMGRLADLYLEEKQDKESSKAILNQIVEKFPETRYSANARHKINEIESSS